MAGRNCTFLSVGLLSLGSLIVLFLREEPIEPGRFPRIEDVIEERDEGPTMAVIDSGLPADLDRHSFRVVKVYDFTGEGPFDHHGHGSKMVRLAARALKESQAAMKEFAKEKQDWFRQRWPDLPRQWPEFFVDKVAKPTDRLNLVIIKVIDKFGLTNPARILEGMNAAAQENVDSALLALNVWLSQAEAEVYWPVLEQIVRTSKCGWLAAWPNDAAKRSKEALVRFPSSSQLVLSIGFSDESSKVSEEEVVRSNVRTAARGVALDFVRKGQQCYAARSYKEARVCFQQAVFTDHTFPDAWLNLGTLWMEMGQKESAEMALKTASELDPSCKEAHYNLGVLWSQGAKPDLAIEALKKAITADARFDRAHALLGSILSESGNVKDGIRHCREAVVINPDNASFQFDLSRAYLYGGLSEDAITAGLRAVERDPKHSSAHATLGQAYRRIGQFDKSFSHFRAALALKEDSATAHWNFSLALWDGGLRKEAVKHYKRAVELNPALGKRAHPVWDRKADS
jgi:tetratricopeptide (TPR) repeat protein